MAFNLKGLLYREKTIKIESLYFDDQDSDFRDYMETQWKNDAVELAQKLGWELVSCTKKTKQDGEYFTYETYYLELVFKGDNNSRKFDLTDIEDYISEKEAYEERKNRYKK